MPHINKINGYAAHLPNMDKEGNGICKDFIVLLIFFVGNWQCEVTTIQSFVSSAN